MYQGQAGTQLCTTAAGQSVGPVGQPVRVYALEILSGGTAGEIKLYNGTSAVAANLFIQEVCTAVSTGNKFEYGTYGILFPKGCWYAEVSDANVVSTLISFAHESPF
jgi:hypothetical protein